MRCSHYLGKKVKKKFKRLHSKGQVITSVSKDVEKLKLYVFYGNVKESSHLENNLALPRNIKYS